MASVKYARELAELFSDEQGFFLSQDDKARMPIGLPISKKQDVMLMHLEYKVSFRSRFSRWKKSQADSISDASCNRRKENDGIGYSGPTYIAIQSGKHGKSCAASHKEDFQNILRTIGILLKIQMFLYRHKRKRSNPFYFLLFPPTI